MTKFEFTLQNIKEKCSGKQKLNIADICKVMDKSRSWIDIQINQNNLHLLPPFKVEAKKGNYKTYEFDAFDVATFLAGE